MKKRNPFSDLPLTPTEHFKMFFYAAVLHLLHNVIKAYDSQEAAFQQFPFLAGYNNELAESGLAGVKSADALVWWLDSLRDWEAKATEHLPLRALREVTGLDHSAMTLLVGIGLIEEDLRFGLVFEAMQGSAGQHRPTMSLLSGWWREANGATNGRGY